MPEGLIRLDFSLFPFSFFLFPFFSFSLFPLFAFLFSFVSFSPFYLSFSFSISSLSASPFSAPPPFPPFPSPPYPPSPPPPPPPPPPPYPLLPILPLLLLLPLLSSLPPPSPVRNHALGNNPCYPYDACMSTHMGSDLDVLSWEQVNHEFLSLSPLPLPFLISKIKFSRNFSLDS